MYGEALFKGLSDRKEVGCMAWEVKWLDCPRIIDMVDGSKRVEYGSLFYACDKGNHWGGAVGVDVDRDNFNIEAHPTMKGWTFGKGQKCYCPEHASLGKQYAPREVVQESLF